MGKKAAQSVGFALPEQIATNQFRQSALALCFIAFYADQPVTTWSQNALARFEMKTLFTDHPKSVGESYGEHLGQAFYFGGRMLGCGFACLVHGFLPFLFKKTGSDTIEHLHHRMVKNRARAPLCCDGSEKING